MQIKGNIPNRRLTQRGQVAHFKNHFPRIVGFIRESLVQGTADHHGDDLVHIQPFQRLRRNPLSVAQHGNFITQLENFFHFVGDVDNTATAFFQLANNGEQMVDLFFG